MDEKNLNQTEEVMKPSSSNDSKAVDANEGLKKTSFIKNPLPLPKKHVKKEMEYDFEVSPDQMHFDIDNPDKNYYDI